MPLLSFDCSAIYFDKSFNEKPCPQYNLINSNKCSKINKIPKWTDMKLFSTR